MGIYDGTEIIEFPQRPIRADRLTKTEVAVIRLIMQGLTNKQIAERMVMSARTVQAHLTRIYGKLGLVNRTQLAVWGKGRYG